MTLYLIFFPIYLSTRLGEGLSVCLCVCVRRVWFTGSPASHRVEWGFYFEGASTKAYKSYSPQHLGHAEVRHVMQRYVMMDI